MNDATRKLLREALLLDYDLLKAKLAQQLGSAELAGEVLHDTWISLQRHTPLAPVMRPRSYLLRMAHNLAKRRLKSEGPTVTLDEACLALGLIDATPNPEQIAEARADLAVLKQVVAELSPRQRDVLLAARIDGEPLHKLAKRHGVSQRLIERELSAAVLHCANRLQKKLSQRFGPKREKDSER